MADAGSTIAAGLPNITGYFYDQAAAFAGTKDSSGCFSWTIGPWDTLGAYGNGNYGGIVRFDASKSNSIYGNSNSVQPPAYRVYVWKRKS